MLTSLFHLAISILSPVIIGAIGVVVPYVLKLLKVNLDAAHTATLEQALDNAVGTALSLGQSAGDSYLANVTIKDAALAKAVSYVSTYAPAAIAYFGLTPASIAEKVDAKLAKLLHVTNTVPPVNAAKADYTAAMLSKANIGPAVTPTTI